MNMWKILNECLFDNKLNAYAKKEDECCIERPEYNVIGAVGGHFDGVVVIITQQGMDIKSYVLEVVPHLKEIKVVRCVFLGDVYSPSSLHRGSKVLYQDEIAADLMKSLGLSTYFICSAS